MAARNFGITLGRPALRAPPCPGIDEDSGRSPEPRSCSAHASAAGSKGKQRLQRGQLIAGDGLCQFQVLLDHVRPARGDPLCEKPARHTFPRLDSPMNRRLHAIRPMTAERTAP